MEIIDYKRLFEIKYDGGWSDDNVWYAKCRFCGVLPIFNKYNIKNWNILNSDQRKKRFYTAIKNHIKTYHPELILPKRTKKLEQREITFNKALNYLKNFPFRPIKEEVPLESLHFLKNFPFRPIKEEVPKVWKPGKIVLSHSGKEKKE